MSKKTQAIVVFATAIFAAALVPCLMFKAFFARFDDSAIGLVTSALWCSLPVFAAVWSGIAASYLIRRNGRVGFWRGAAIGLLALLGCSLLWAFVMVVVSGNAALAGALAVVLFALAMFGVLAAGVGGISGWLTGRLLRDAG